MQYVRRRGVDEKCGGERWKSDGWKEKSDSGQYMGKGERVEKSQ